MVFDDCERAARTFAAEKDRADASLVKMMSALEILRKGARTAEKRDKPDVLEVVGLIDGEIDELQSAVQGLAQKAATFRQEVEGSTNHTAKSDDVSFWADCKTRVNELYTEVRELAEKMDPFKSMFRARARRQVVAQKSDEELQGPDAFQSMFNEARKADPGPKGLDAFKCMFGE